MELLLWPLLPFAGVWASGRAVWAGIALGGAGLVVSLFRQGLAPWGAAAAAWAVASLFIGRQKPRKEASGRDARTTLAALKEDVARLEAEHAALKKQTDRLEREDASAYQTYSLAKSLTESVSWESLSSRFSQVLQKVTGSNHFLLYLASGAGALELKLKSGDWPKDAVPQAPAQKHPQWMPGGAAPCLEAGTAPSGAAPGLGSGTAPSGAANLLQVPLWRGEELLGLLWVRWPTASHPPIEDIEDLFEHLLAGFQKAQLFARVESMSRIDGLTGVLRRQAFMDQMETEWKRAGLFKTNFCFMLVDIDHFKKINDRFGHPAGDAVLSRLGALLREGIYETDAVGRYGGEEFGVLMPRADPQGVMMKAERLRQRVEAETFTGGLEAIRLSISVGVAHFPRDGRTVAEVMEAADKALYFAKENGRNRVVDFASLNGKSH